MTKRSMKKKTLDLTDGVGFEELNEYEEILQDFKTILITSSNVLELFPKITQEYTKQEKIKIAKLAKTMTPEEIKQVKQFSENFGKQIKQIKKWPASISGKFFFRNRPPAELVGMMMNSHNIPRNTIPFVNEMSLVYLIINFEEFLKNILRLTFKNKPTMLSTNKEMTHEEILSFDNIGEIRNRMIEKETGDIISKDVEKIGQHLQDFFKLNLKHKKNWNEFTERFYRRHIIVHNNGIPDEKYRLKIKRKIVKRLDTDQKYMFESINIFHDYAVTITKFFEKKYLVIKKTP